MSVLREKCGRGSGFFRGLLGVLSYWSLRPSWAGAEAQVSRRSRRKPGTGGARASAVLLACIGVALALGTVARSGPALSSAAAKGHERLLGTTTPVSTLAADGSIAAVSTECGKRFLENVAWNPVLRSVVSMAPGARGCGGSSTGEGIWEQGMAGRRLAWVRYEGGNYRSTYLFTATVGRPRLMTMLVRQTIHNTDDGTGDWVGNVRGDGSLLVFNTWRLCYSEPEIPGSCPAGVPPKTYHIYNEKLWRVVGARKRLLVASKDQLTVLSVAAGRILVQRADGSLELRRADGKLARAFRFERGQVLGAQLDASELVVLERASGLRWRVYDSRSGELKRTLRAPARAMPADVERGLLVYTVGRVAHVLRLRDGHQKRFTAPAGTWQVLAQIEPAGLFYSYSVGRKGRVRFVPFNEIRFR